MSYFIYTISHPFTNEVVYVGCTSDFEKRKLAYLRKRTITRPIDVWIENLRENYILPKIEILCEASEDNVFEDEMFWIRMMKCWGFDLLNVFKLNPPKDNLYSTNPSSYTGNPIVRKYKKWEIADFELGNKFEIENNYPKRNAFYTVFRSYAKQFNLIRYLKFDKVENVLVATVVDTKPKKIKVEPKFIWPKGKDRKQRTDGVGHLFEPLRKIGGSIEIKPPTHFNSLKSLISYHLKDIKIKRMNYIEIGNGIYKVIRIY